MTNRGQARACLVACALAVALPAPAQSLRPQDLVELIVREGPRAVALRAGVDVVEREQAARRAWPNPSVSLSQEGAGFTQFFQAEQALPVFGIRARLARAGVAATEGAAAERDAALWQLRCDGAEAVAGWLAARTRARLANDTVSAVDRVVSVLRIREQEGEGSRLDRVRAEQELADVRRDLVGTEAALAIARAALTALLPPGAVLGDVPGGPGPGDPPAALPALQAQAREQRAELRALERATARAGFEADAAGPARFPVPTVTAGLKRADTAPGVRESGAVVGVGLSIPLFDRGRAEAGRWTAEQRRLSAEQSALAHEIDAEIAGRLEALRARRAALDVEAGRASPDELLAMADAAYREGEVGVVALLDAVRTVARMRARESEMRAEVRLAELALERSVGGVLWR